MKTRALTLASVAAAALFTGCGLTSIEYTETTRTVVESEEPNPYVNTYLPLSYSIKAALEPHVYGWFSPSTSRYSDFLYYQNAPRSSYNKPCYVEADFNGDGYLDYAFLFSKESLYYSSWDLSTKLIVLITKPRGGYAVTDVVLGTVSADNHYAISENWAISLLTAGQYTRTVYTNGASTSETVDMPTDGFVLTAEDNGEQDLYYAEGNQIFYEQWNLGSLGKKASTGKSVKTLWKDVVPMKVR